MASHSTPHHARAGPKQVLLRWQAARTWARLIREAECLWHVDVRTLHRLAAEELGQLQNEVPANMRQRVNSWLRRLGVATRLGGLDPPRHKKAASGQKRQKHD